MEIKVQKKIRKLLILLLFLSSLGQVCAQEVDVDKFKAMFTINFIRYIGWDNSTKESDFVIGVLKEKRISNHLKANTIDKKVGFQNLVVKEFDDLSAITECQILYISSGVNINENTINLITSKLKNQTLIISEGASKNTLSMINFVIVDYKLKFEIYTANVEKAGLKLSNSLTALNNAIVKK